MTASRKQLQIRIPKSLYNLVYWPFIEARQRYQILFGGSSSGKSRFLAQRYIRDILKGGRNVLACRKFQNTLKKSVYNELKQVIDYWDIGHLFTINKSELSFTCVNGYQILLAGLDDIEKLKSIVPQKGIITDIWVEEATEISYDDFKQLEKRMRGWSMGMLKRFTFSFNPILRSHWIFKHFFQEIWKDDDKLVETGETIILKTTYKDNRFLAPDDIKALENETDEYYYQVYTLGNWGVLGDFIFTNWKVADILNDPVFKTFDITRHGLDFGYSNDPTAYNATYYNKALKRLYIFDEWHDIEVTNPEIAEALKPKVNGDRIVCDSAEPKSIAELQNEGLNAVGAEKGKDSVLHGIQWLKQQEIIIDVRCHYTKEEFQMYHWKKDKNGNVLNVPVDAFNHHIDNIRYQNEELMLDGDFEMFTGAPTVASTQPELF